MTTTTEIFAQRHDPDVRSERAQRAVKVFRSMLPTINAFARALTGRNDVKVVLDSGTPRTDGDKIYYHPPISLGDNLRHEPMLCEKRDPMSQVQRCAACARREDIMVTIYHELGHIIFGTFDMPTSEQRAAIVSRGVQMAGGKRAASVAARIKKAPYWKTERYLDLAGLVSEYLPFLINALDDARVNREMFKARPGMKPMFEAQAWDILNNGVERDDDSVAEWKNMPLDAQAGVAILCKAAGYNFDGLLDPRVELAMRDKDLTALVNRMDSIRSMSGVYELSYPILQRLQELGFMRNPDDEPEPEEESDAQEEPDAEDSDESASEGDTGDEGDSDASDPDGSGPGEPDSSDSEVDDGSGVPTDDQESGTDGAGDPSEDEENVDGDREGADGSGDDGAAGEPEAAGDDAGSDGEPAGAGDGDDAESGSEPADGLVGEQGPGESDGKGADAAGDDDSVAAEPDSGDDGVGDGDTGPADGMADGEPGESGGEGSTSDDEESSAGDAGGSDAGADDGDEAEPGDRSGEAGTGEIGEDPEAGDAGGEAGSGSGGEAGSGAPDGDAKSNEPAGDRSPEVPDSGDGAGDPGLESGDADGAEGGEPSDHGDSSESSAAAPLPDSADLPAGDGQDDDDDTADGAPEDAAGQDPVADPSGTPSEDGAVGTDQPDAATDDPSDPADGGDPIDTGADEGQGGLDLTDLPELPQGSADDMGKALKQFGGHDETKVDDLTEQDEEAAVKIAVIQGEYFEKPSANVSGVNVFRYPSDDNEPGWNHSRYRRSGYSDSEIGVESDMVVPESVLGPVLQRLRVAFSDNRRSKTDRNRKSGKVNGQVLGKRAWGDDDRLFAKKTIPGKKDYFVVLGVDISGSTVGVNIGLAKRAAMAYSELLNRLGIPFAVYAHTATRPKGVREYDFTSDYQLSLDIYEVKGKDDPWSTQQKEALAQLGPVSNNLDGHSVEFYRKRLDESRATNKVMLYFTDGKMPAANYEEELEVLQAEIATCKKKKYTLLGVGIRTDSPTRHGLDTVQVDTDEDLIKVVRHLEKELA